MNFITLKPSKKVSLVMVLTVAMLMFFLSPAFADNDVYLPSSVTTATGDDTRIHSNYTKNTDACAACHFTHTAVGERLLQWSSIYATCAACHDGSLGDYTYDVFSGKIGTSSTRTFGGLFGDSTTVDSNYYDWTTNGNVYSLSNHMPTGYASLAAAPGSDIQDHITAGASFNCASCHTPHGQGGNARILSPDPGKARIDNYFASNVNYPVTISDASFDYKQRLYTTRGGSNGTVTTNTYFYDSYKNWIEGYPYSRITAVFVYNTEPIINFNPNDSSKLGVYSTATKLTEGRDYDINYREGKIYLKNSTVVQNNIGKQVWVSRVPGIFIAMDIDNYLENDETVEYVAMEVDAAGWDGASDNNEGINAFCGACHGKYNTQGRQVASEYGYGYGYDFVNNASGKNHGSGHYPDDDAKYRHQVGFKWVGQWTGDADYIKFSYQLNYLANGEVNKAGDKIFTCLSCHFAHGTDNKYWYDYVKAVVNNSATITASDYDSNIPGAPDDMNQLSDMEELFGSSALKRLPNMSVCEDCHDKASGNTKDKIDGETYY